MEQCKETINSNPEKFIQELVDALRPYLDTKGSERRRIRARFLVCLYRLGYYNRAFYTGPRLSEVDQGCAAFLDFTKD